MVSHNGHPLLAELKNSVHANDLADNTPECPLRIEILPYSLEPGDMLPLCQQKPGGRSTCTAHNTYVLVQILDSLRQDFPCVLGPVRPARELINESLR